MNEKRGSLHLLTGAVIGILIGLVISLVLLPVSYTDTEPYSLKEEDRVIYRNLVARAYMVEADTPRALARLNLLKDASPAEELVFQAQKQLAENGNDQQTRALALLAAAVSQPSIRITPIPLLITQAVNGTVVTTQQVPTLTLTPKATRTPAATFTPRPTFTPQATQGAPFTLLEQTNICEVGEPESLIQIFVVDAAGNPVPGVRIEISIPNGGTEYFYTGLYPEISPGYADYLMLPGMIYNLRVGETGQQVMNLAIPACEDDAGNPFAGSIRLDFKQPQ